MGKARKDSNPDEGMAVAFEDMLAHRELLQILSQYGNGYRINIFKDFKPDLSWGVRNARVNASAQYPAEPAYRVGILKYKSVAELAVLERNNGDFMDNFKWQAFGMHKTYLGALRRADREAKKFLLGESRRI